MIEETSTSRARLSESGLLLRWGLVVTAVVLSVALVGNSLLSYRNVQRAATSLAMAEGESLFRDVEERLAEFRGPADDTLLQSSLELAENLHGLAVVSDRAGVLASAGEVADWSSSLPPPPGGAFVNLQSKRAVFVKRLRDRPPPRRGPRGIGPPQPRDSGRERGEGRPRRPPPLHSLVLVFEPVLAEQSRAAALQNVVLGGLASGASLIAAGFIWRLLVQRERLQQRRHEESTLRTLGEMSAVLAHEIRNPLASLKGNAQLLTERLADGSAEHKKAQRLVSEATRLERLSTDLLELARTQKPSKTETNVKALIERAVEAAGVPGVKVVAFQAPESWRVDADRIQQVLVNLIRNAHQANLRQANESGARGEGRDGREGDVTVGAQETQDVLHLAVLDRGPGVDEVAARRIFEPFFTTRTQGTGLGLAVSRRIVEMHDGDITVVPRDGGGSVFTVRLPGDVTS